MTITDFPPPRRVARSSRLRLRRIPRRRVTRLLGSLVFATFICLGMVFGGYVTAENGPPFDYLVWNLFLAWVPLLLALVAYRNFRSGHHRLVFMLCSLAWFFFFPNAPYITTDIIHIHDDNISRSWYHLLTIMAYAWTGLSLGFVSLYLMQEIIRARFNRVVEWIFVLAMLGAGTLGTYFGRFLRWNSWDVLSLPVRLLWRGYHKSLPYDAGGDGAFLVMMFTFLILSYFMLYSLTHLHEPVEDRP